MLNILHRWAPWLLFLAGLFLAILARDSSSSFQQCAAQETKSGQEKQEKSSPGIFASLIARTHISWRCTGEFIDQNNAAITAIATVFIAIFTTTLWRATTDQGRLTRESIKLARDEFISTHRPKIVIHSVEFCYEVGDGPDDVTAGAEVFYFNAGITPASITEITIHVTRRTFPLQSGILAGGKQRLVPAGKIDGGGKGRIPVTTGIKVEKERITQRDGASERGRVLCFGRIVYADDRGVRRETGFCRQLDVIGERWLPVENSAEYEYAY